MSHPSALFSTYWLAGYEGADHINTFGLPLSMNRITQHDARARDDYLLLHEFGVGAVRESVGWRISEPSRNGYTFSSAECKARAARELGIQVVWTLCHYGIPPDIDIFSPEFVHRFARFCGEAARRIAPLSDLPPVYAPINEISFLTWAVCETRLIYPHTGTLRERQPEFKRQLIRAVIAGCEAIWNEDPRARLIHTDPLIHVVAPFDRPDLAKEAATARSFQFEAWEMLRGAVAPELGGAPKYLDILGIDYYHDNQWEHDSERRLHWHLDDPRRVSLSKLLEEVHERFHRPLFIAETSHFGAGRGRWIREIAAQTAEVVARGIPVGGICLYPVLDRPDWNDPDHWHQSGLWDLIPNADGRLSRIVDPAYRDAFLAARMTIDAIAPRTAHPLNMKERSCTP